MIRRALTTTLAALALMGAAAACTPNQSPAGGGENAAKDTAAEFITVYQSGDEAAACELADREIGDCTTRPSITFTEEPAAGEVFENEETGTTAVIVTYTTEETPDSPDTWAVELTEDGKVTQWEDMSGDPKNRETVAMVLEWSE